jgi:hypothetical protein
MGRRPEPVSYKIGHGAYRPDLDKSMTGSLSGDVPETPEGLGTAGKQFWTEGKLESGFWAATGRLSINPRITLVDGVGQIAELHMPSVSGRFSTKKLPGWRLRPLT